MLTVRGVGLGQILVRILLQMLILAQTRLLQTRRGSYSGIFGSYRPGSALTAVQTDFLELNLNPNQTWNLNLNLNLALNWEPDNPNPPHPKSESFCLGSKRRGLVLNNVICIFSTYGMLALRLLHVIT